MPYSLRTKLKHLAYERDITVKECERLIKALDTLDKVKQAREEMKGCSYSLRCFNEDVFDEDERVVDLDNVLIILDKLIAESEEQE